MCIWNIKDVRRKRSYLSATASIRETEDGENDEQYYIENVYIDAKSGKETDTPEDIEELVSTGSTEPLFQIVAPNICNNIDLDSPLGISVYANGIDEVKAAILPMTVT